MLIKNAIAYRIGPNGTAEIDAALARREFTPCGAYDAQRSGFARIRDTFSHAVGPYTLIRLCTETKVMPAKAVKKLVSDRCAVLEKNEGYKPGRKRRREPPAERPT